MLLYLTRRATSLELPMAMRFRHLKKTSKEAVGVYRLVGLEAVPLVLPDKLLSPYPLSVFPVHSAVQISHPWARLIL